MSISKSNYLFDIFIAVDFSGANDPRQQRKHIAFAEMEHGLLTPRVEDELKFTRSDAVTHLMERLHCHDFHGKRVLRGFDFQYSFPIGFWHTLTGLQETWDEMTRGILEWFQEKRLVGQRVKDIHLKNIQPIFKVGGGGSVGLQSLCGIPHLSRIRADCSRQSIPLCFWPFDGWELTDCRHVLIEWYPAIHNRGPKSDKNDASACVRWASEGDEEGTLSHYFTPILSDSEKTKATFEGWILGVR